MSKKCCQFDVAEFRHRIVIEQLSLTPNDSGGSSESWSTFATVWAKITPKTNLERYFAQREEPLNYHDIKIRYLAGLTTTMRISFDSRIFEIKSVTRDNEMKEFMTVLAAERTGT